jgi:hypothetical protein
MYTDLVHAAGNRAAFNQGIVLKVFQRLEPCFGPFPLLPADGYVALAYIENRQIDKQVLKNVRPFNNGMVNLV